MKFPNEKPRYRAARDKLLKAELALRKQVEQVAALRRKLPPGGENVLDFSPERRGKDWYPKLDYAALTREKS